MREEILQKLNEYIRDSKGSPVLINDMVKDAQLDSLGLVYVLVCLDSDYHFMDSEEDLDNLDRYSTMTVMQLINTCVKGHYNIDKQ